MKHFWKLLYVQNYQNFAAKISNIERCKKTVQVYNRCINFSTYGGTHDKKHPQRTGQSPASRPSVILDKETARYIFRALLLTIVFAWALINLQAVLQFLGRVLAVFSPFLMGGAIAFVINILLCPLERTWQRICKKRPTS